MSTTRVRLSDEVATILSAGSIDDDVYRLPAGQLQGRTYKKVEAALGALGTEWSKGVGGFPVGVGFAADLEAALESGVAVDSSREETFDPQPGEAGDYPGPQEWMDFTVENGRIPFAADSPPTWAYSGWLRYLVLVAEDSGLLKKRWHYVFESIDNGHVLDTPLPATDFSGAHQAGEKAARIFMGWCDLLDGSRSHWERMRLVMEFLAWGFGIGDAPPKISDEEALRLYAGHETGKSARRGVNSRDLIELYKHPCDLFGYTLSQSIGSGWNPNAFYPTPEGVVMCMVEMTTHDTKDVDQRGMMVNDCCCGTGRMLIHAGQRSMRLYAQDIDYMMVLATKINFAFWCPWGLYQWDDEFFDVVGLPGPPVKARTGQLALFGGTVQLDKKNRGRPRAEVEAESRMRSQLGLFSTGDSD